MMEIISRQSAMSAGSIHYFTGKKCPNGHVSVRFVSSYACKECAVFHHQKYRKNDPEFIKREMAYKALYRANDENKKKARDYASRMWKENSEIKIRNLIWKAANRALINERQSSKNQTEEQRQKSTAHRKRMYEKFREDRLARAKSHRGIRRGAEGKFTKSDISKMLDLQCNKCTACSVSLSNGYHVDHIMPLSKGGSNWPSNLQCLCPPCNLKKKDKHPLDWARENGRLM